MEIKNIGMIAGVALLTGASLYNNSGSAEEKCLVYQGHRAMDDTNIAVFDDKSFSERTGTPDLVAAYTEPENVETLEVGKEYLVKFREQKLAGLPKLLSTSLCN